MVRLSIVLAVCILFLKFRGSVKLESDHSDDYVNYSDSVSFPFNMDSLFVTINPDSLNVANFIGNAEKKPLCESFSRYVETKNYTLMEIDTNRINYNGLKYFACGRINLNHGVKGYLVLRKKPNEMERAWDYSLSLLNVKNDRLSSMLVVSCYNLFCLERVSQKMYINYDDYLFLLTDNSFLCGIDGGLSRVDDFWSRIGLLKPRKLKYKYLSFTLDENGCVKRVPLEEDKFPEYLK